MNDTKRYIWIAGFVVFMVLCSMNLWYGIGLIAVVAYFMGNKNNDNENPWQ